MKKKKSNPLKYIVIAVVLLAFTACAAAGMLNLTWEIREAENLTARLEGQKKILQNLNAALALSIVSELTDEDYIRIAKDKLGLAFPGERIFVNVGK